MNKWKWPNRRGVTIETLQRRCEYGGRKGRAAVRRIRAENARTAGNGNGRLIHDRVLLLSMKGLVIDRRRRKPKGQWDAEERA